MVLSGRTVDHARTGSMKCLNHVFRIEELEQLDERQLAILDDAIVREIQTNPGIKKILHDTLKEHLLDRWAKKKKNL
jgi:hypothetical protein